MNIYLIILITFIILLLLLIIILKSGLSNKDACNFNQANNVKENIVKEEKEVKSNNKIEDNSNHTFRKIIIYIFLIIWALIVIFPFYWMIITSLKSFTAYNAEQVPSLIAMPPTIINYLTAFKEVSLARYLVNTLLFSVGTTIITVVVITLAAFAFARLNFKGKNIIFIMFLALMMIPNELVVITNYTTAVNLNLRNTFTGLVLPSIMSIFYVYWLKQVFSQVPNEIYLAAKVDGTSDFKYMYKVLVPIAKPTMISITLLKFIECWNLYVWPRLITTDSKYYLVSQGVQMIKQNGFGRENIPAMMAAVVVVSLPILIIFIIFRRQIMSGVSREGTKG